MIPFPGLDLELDRFLAGGESHQSPLATYPSPENIAKVALVVPIYEITTDVQVDMPRNKSELMEYVKVSSDNCTIESKAERDLC